MVRTGVCSESGHASSVSGFFTFIFAVMMDVVTEEVVNEGRALMCPVDLVLI